MSAGEFTRDKGLSLASHMALAQAFETVTGRDMRTLNDPPLWVVLSNEDSVRPPVKFTIVSWTVGIEVDADPNELLRLHSVAVGTVPGLVHPALLQIKYGRGAAHDDLTASRLFETRQEAMRFYKWRKATLTKGK